MLLPEVLFLCLTTFSVTWLMPSMRQALYSAISNLTISTSPWPPPCHCCKVRRWWFYVDFIFYLFRMEQRDVQTGGSIIQTVTNLWQQLHLLETRQENNQSLRANRSTWSKKASWKVGYGECPSPTRHFLQDPEIGINPNRLYLLVFNVCIYY